MIGESGKSIPCLQYRNALLLYLVDDASTSAQLAHAMFFGSMDKDRLIALYSTRAVLPQVHILNLHLSYNFSIQLMVWFLRLYIPL